MAKLNDIEQLEVGKQELKELQDAQQKYCEDNYYGIKDDMVEGEESDEGYLDLQDQIDELQQKIDDMEYYLADKYAPLPDEGM